MRETRPELMHPVPLDQAEPWLRASATPFLRDPDGTMARRVRRARTATWQPERAWGFRDGERWVSTLLTEARTLTVPGADTAREVAVDAVTAVTVSATHRRRGLLRAMLGEALRAAHARGDLISILIAAEWPIYGRYGFAPAALSARYELLPRRSGGTTAGEPGALRQVERAEAAAAAPAVFQAARLERAGQIDRAEAWWRRLFGSDGGDPAENLHHHWFLHEGSDGADGVLGWRATRDAGLQPPFGAVEAELVTVGEAAYRDAWAYLCGLDLVEEVALDLRPVDEPGRWLLHDARALVQRQVVDFLWLRLLDVPGALAARQLACDGELVLEITDPDGEGYAAGRYALCQRDGAPECAPTHRPAQLELSQRALASAYLGGFRLSQLAIAGGVRELSPGALARADVMLSTPHAPWCATWF